MTGGPGGARRPGPVLAAAADRGPAGRRASDGRGRRKRSAAGGGRTTLEDNIAWALGQAPTAAPRARPSGSATAIDRLQGERSQIGSFDRDVRRGTRPDRRRRPGREDGAAGRGGATGEVVRKAAQGRARRDRREGARPEKKVVKELGFFLKYEPGKTPVLSRDPA
ncbi:MAG: hypothetical protein M0C28_42215 [Candidatus Moduliflexus flocculans]|nr:hypothetical protein [Candidatus Moduliflexus flocculans]